jgi:rhodanese-related sulfurtransferase
METPGHTPESISVLVIDTEISDQPQKILTGDTLFIGDVGRPDLAGGKGYTPQTMAEMMYDTLHGKLLRLADETEVYPAHGAGSMCGRNISKETHSTIGVERKFNYALKPMSKDQFVHMMTADLPEAPDYFSRDAEINRHGAAGLQTIPSPVALEPQEVAKLAAGGHVILDVRSPADFGAAHIPKSFNIGLEGQFAIWSACLIPMSAAIIIVADSEEQVDQAVIRLARVGIESAGGYLSGGIEAWRNAGLELATVPQITAAALNDLIHNKQGLQIVDVRRPSEFASGHVPRATAAPLSGLQKHLPDLDLDPERLTAVICAGGYRSSAAASILQQHGFANLLNVSGGTSGWISAGYPVEVHTAN